jgi:parallel beta-helix repeat protein
MMALLVFGILTLFFNIKPVWASGTISINADGSITPSTAPIYSADNITYTLTGNVTSDFNADGIVVGRDNIVFDGAGYTVRGYIGGLSGFDLTGITNVTIKNTSITSFQFGISLDGSFNDTISGNNVTPIHYGTCISLESSSNNSIVGNNVEFGAYSINLDSSSNNSIVGNSFTQSLVGIELVSSSDNKLYHNNFLGDITKVAIINSTNIWDDGYPTGGNYWSGYSGVDYYSGPYQNETYGDGIGDTPYAIGTNNTDHYPLMVPYAVPEFPSLLILSLFFMTTLLAVIFYRKRRIKYA